MIAFERVKYLWNSEKTFKKERGKEKALKSILVLPQDKPLGQLKDEIKIQTYHKLFILIYIKELWYVVKNLRNSSNFVYLYISVAYDLDMEIFLTVNNCLAIMLKIFVGILFFR